MARVSFVLRQLPSSGSGGFLRYPEVTGGAFPARTDYDSALRADGLQLPAAATGLSTFSATTITYQSVLLDWSVPLVTASSVVGPTSLAVVYSPAGVPQTVSSGQRIVSTTNGISDLTHDSLASGSWAYYGLFINYTSTAGDNYFVKVAELEVLVPVDYGSALTLWNQLPEYARTADIRQGTTNYSSNIGTTHGDKVGPLFKYLSIIGYDMDYLRTLIDYVMISSDPLVANGETLDALASLMNVALQGSQLGEQRLRGIVDNIGVYKRSKGTPAAVKQMIGGITGSNVIYNDTNHQYTIQSQRANYITTPKTGLTNASVNPVWREAYPGESTAGTALNLLRGAEFFIDAGRAVNAEQAALNQGTGGSVLNARYGSGTGVDASDPLLLLHTGTNHLYLPGVASNYVSIPDNPSLALTGVIEIVMRVSLDDWTPTGGQILVGKWRATQYSWHLRVTATGAFQFFVSTDGTTSGPSETTSVPSPALVDGSSYWIRARYTPSVRQLVVGYSPDTGQAEPTSYGTTLTSTGGASLSVFQPASPLEIGTVEAGSTLPLAGKIYRTIIRNGSGGSTALDVDFTTGLTSGNQVSVPFAGTALATFTPQYVSNLGTGGRALVAKVGNSANVGTDDPMLLTHTGENYYYTATTAASVTVSNNFALLSDNGGATDLGGSPGITYLSLPGIVGHYASTPSNAALQIAGDIDIVFGCSFDTLTPASSVGLFGRDGADPNRVWALALTSTGALSFRWYPTGSLASQIIKTSTVTLQSVGITAGQRVNLRVFLDVDNGATGNDVKFYYSTDFGATYTQLGATVTTAGVTSLATTTSAALTVNPDLGGTPFAGKVYIAVVRSGFGGTNVFISDFTTAIMGSSTFVDGGQVGPNGMLVTLTGSLAKFVDGTTFFSVARSNTDLARDAYCQIADNASFTPTTSLSYRIALAAVTWTPPSSATLGGHYGGVDFLRSSLLQVNTGASPVFLLSVDGSNTAGTTTSGQSTFTATQGITTSAGSIVALRYDWVSTGPTVNFYTKATSASSSNADCLSDSGWTLLGTAITAGVPTSIMNTTSSLFIGGNPGNNPLAGRYYATVLKVDGTTQVNIDFTQQVLYAPSFTETSTNLANVTVVTGAGLDARIDRVRDVELVTRVALDDWTCAGVGQTQNLIGRGYGNDFLWFVTSSNVQFYGTMGSANGNFSNLAWPLASRPANGATIWMKVTRNSTTGVATLYTAADSSTEPSSWVTASSVLTSIGNFKGNTKQPTVVGGALGLGMTQAAVPATGKFYRAIVRNGIGGPAVVDIDFTKSITSGAQTSVLTGGTAAQYATNLSTVSGASVLTARSGTLPASDGADPVLLPWTGTNYVWFDAIAGPNRLAISTTVVTPTMLVGSGTLEWRCKAFVDSTSAELMGTSNTFIFGLYIAGGNLSLGLQIAGTDYFMNLGAVPVGRVVTYRATFDPVSGNAIGYYSLNDGATWVTLNTVVHAGAVSVFLGSFYLGQIAFGIAGPCSARIYTAELITSGTRTLYFNSAVDITSGDQASGTATSGQTFTIQRHTSGRKTATVVRPIWVFGSSDFMEVQDNNLLDVTASENLTVVAIVRQWGTPTNYGRYISKKNGNPAAGWELLTSTTTTGVFLEIADGTNTAAAPVSTPTTGALAMVGAQINRSSNTLRNFVNTTFSTTVSTSTVTGTLANGFPMRIGKRADYSGNQEFELVAVAVFKSVVSDANLATIYNYYINGGTDATSILQTANFWIDAALSPPAFAITRATTDHKAVLVTRPTFLFGGNDYMSIADNDLLDFALTDSFTMVAALRQWGSPSNDVRIFSKGAAGTPSSPAISFLQKSSFGTSLRIDAGTTGQTSESLSPVPAAGALTVFSGVRNASTDSLITYSGASAGASVADITTLGVANTATFLIGADYGGGTPVYFGEFEMYGAAVFRRALNATEVALINTHYQGTETPESTALLSTAVFWIDPARSSQEMAINRSTAAGKKAVAVTRPTWLFGLDDYMEVPDNDLLDFSDTDSFTVVGVVRQWGTVPADSRIVMKWSNAGGIQSGWYLTNGNPSTNQLMAVNGVSAGTASAVNTSATTGTVNTMIGVRNTATDQVILYVNGVAGTALVDSTVGTLANPGPMTIGRQDIGGAQYAQMELLAVAVFRRALTATEIAAINTYYGTV